MIIYLLVIVQVQIRLLWLNFETPNIFGPGLVLWVPYYENQYGFDGVKCGLKPSNFYTFNYTNIQLTGLLAILLFLIMAIKYCTLSARLQYAKRAIKNILIFVVGVIGYVVVYDLMNVILKFAKGGYQLSIFSVTFAVLIGYILAFHFSKLCEPSFSKQKLQHHFFKSISKKGTNNMDQPKQPPPATQHTVHILMFHNFTGQFTTVTRE